MRAASSIGCSVPEISTLILSGVRSSTLDAYHRSVAARPRSSRWAGRRSLISRCNSFKGFGREGLKLVQRMRRALRIAAYPRFQSSESEADGRQCLARFVMQVAGDSLPF